MGLRMQIVALTGVAALGWPVLGQIAPPAPMPSAPAATMPAAVVVPAATAPADMLPSAEKVMENLLRQQGGTPVIAAPSTGPATAAPAVAGAAPNQPAATRLREGQVIWNRVGRLVKDEKSGGWVLAFEADGTQMQDPPIALLPCRYLESMESASEQGAKAIKFKVSGQVTEYHGKNYLLITFMQTVRDMNQF